MAAWTRHREHFVASSSRMGVPRRTWARLTLVAVIAPGLPLAAFPAASPAGLPTGSPTGPSAGLLAVHAAALHAATATAGPSVSTAAPVAPRPPQPAPIADEGPLRNSSPLPDQQIASAALRVGDDAWDASLVTGEADRDSARVRAFDSWRNALVLSTSGDGLRLLTDPDARRPWLPDPDGTHARRSEDAAVAVQRRLAAIPDEARTAWVERFAASAEAALRRELQQEAVSQEGLGQVERTYPATVAACRAALAMADLMLEEGLPFKATVWTTRAEQHVDLGAAAWGNEWAAASRSAVARRRAEVRGQSATGFVGDHSRPQAALPGPRPTSADPPVLRLEGSYRISGISRTPDEPLGRGLGSGVAVFRDGSLLVQGAYGVLLAAEVNDGWKVQVRERPDVLFGADRPIVRASASAGGWKSYPACDGEHAALVFGRGTRRRPLQDIEVPPAGNTLGVLEYARQEQALDPTWVLRDGYQVRNPTRKPDPADQPGISLVGGKRRLVAGWDFGRGWEFQPGPLIVDGSVFVLARGMGDPTHEGSDHADEVRLINIDLDSGDLRWSREVTTERGLIDPAMRGRAGYFATTTMPLNIDRSTGHLLVGTNVGLVSAYDVADGRLAWAIRTQRRSASDRGWPGSRPVLVVGDTAWATPFDSEFAYALPTGPAPLDGSLFREPPRARRGAIDLAAVDPGSAGQPSRLVLLGRDGRFNAVLVEDALGTRHPATFLAPDEGFAGRPAVGSGGLIFAGTREVGILGLAAELRLVAAASIPSLGAGRGGDVVLHGGHVHVIGRDTVWIWGRE